MSDADDLFNKANGLFEKIGQTLRREAERVVEPFREPLGAIHIELDRNHVAVGDTVAGRVVLDLAKPVAADRLEVSLLALLRTTALERREIPVGNTTIVNTTSVNTTSGNTASGQRPGGASTFTVHRDVFNFEWSITADTLAKLRRATTQRAFVAGDVLRGITSLFDRELTWKVTATLSVPSQRPITASVDLEIDD